MWDFMKKPPHPVCPMKPPHVAIRDLEEYRQYVLKSLECYYKKILEELSVTDPASLEKLNEVIQEYNSIESAIDVKLTQMEEMLNSFIQTYEADSIKDLRLYYVYDPATKNLSYRIGKEGEQNG